MEASKKPTDPFPGPALLDAAADLQQSGVSATFSGPGGKGATISDPMETFLELCAVAAETDPATDPWPERGGEPEEFVLSELGRRIGDGMIEGVYRLAPLAQFRIDYLFRRKDNWKDKGRNVLGQMKRPSGLLKMYSRADYVLLLDYRAWLAMTPMQRVALVYHELRHGDAEGKIRGHDFEGFFDELKLFGTDTYRDWQALADAVDNGERVQHQYSLGLELTD